MSQWRRDAAVTASMAQQADSGQSFVEFQLSITAKERLEQKQKDREISAFPCQKPKSAHNSYTHLIDLQIANGNKLLEEHTTK